MASRLVVIVLMLASSSVGFAEQKPTSASSSEPVQLAYLCSNIAGSTVVAPSWSPVSDRANNQQVLLKYRGDKEIAEASWSIGSASPYYEAVGIGTSMRAGFAVVVFADEYVETYVYNAGATELFYTSVRSGSALLPNSMKSFRGRCKPAGGIVD